jgi:hypothetical protein
MSIKNLLSNNNYNLFSSSMQADNYNYLYTNKNPYYDSQITASTTINTNFTALNLGGGLSNSGFTTLQDNTGFTYTGGLNFVNLYVSITATFKKISPNTNASISLTKDGQNEPLMSACVYVDKTEGHSVACSRIITIQNNDVLRIRGQCSSGTVSLVGDNTPNSNTPGLQLTVIGVPSQKV